MSRRITLDDIAQLPPPGMAVPNSVRFAPGGNLVTYLHSPGGSLTQELWACDLASGREWRLFEPPSAAASEESLSREEALRRERQRQLGTGVSGYAWSEQGDTLLVQAGNQIFVRRGLEGEWRSLTDGGGWLDPRMSRDGGRLAFVRDGELYALDLTTEDAAPLRLTHDASPPGEYGDRPVTNGLAEYIAQEEMDRSTGFWWSPDGRRLAFEQVDNSPAPLFLIPHPGTDVVDVEAHRYPFAGAANAVVKLGVVAVAGGAITWLPLSADADIYLARVKWTPDGQVLAQVLSRDQTRLEVRRFDPDSGAATTLWVDTVEPWINLTDDLRIVHRDDAPDDDYRMLWSSEREGARELYLYDRDGRVPRRLNRGDIFIDGVVSVDAVAGAVYVSGWQVTPLERQLFRLDLAGGAPTRITRQPGTHICALSRDHRGYIDRFDSATTPPTVTVYDIDGTPVVRLQAAAPPDERLDALEPRPPEFITITTRDGETLHGAVYRPPDLPAGARAPVVVSVYGGPHAQMVTDSWGQTASLRAQYLAQEGFIVLRVDNRGSARRGLAFEAALSRNLGDIEVRDQVDGVRALASIPEADLDRVGVYGWSYGGYMALMCLARAPEVFKAAVAGAPVTHWDGYDTCYTERYMGRPTDNPEGYRNSSVMEHAGSITGPLLIVHGMIDENVHFRHTGRLMQKLIEAAIPYDTLFFPEERHGPRRLADRVFLERRIAEFFQRSL